MSEITKETVEKIAKLANISLADNEAASYAGQLEQIINYIHKLNEIDTTGIPQTAHAMPIVNKWREDKAAPGLGREKALSSAPESEDGCFKVPRIIE